MVVGLPGSYESEGFDRTQMRLPANQLDVLTAVADANPNLVMVLVNGSTVELDDVSRCAKALVEAWLGGQAAAGGIADILTGRVNPSGRLAETFPHRLEDNSSYLNFPATRRWCATARASTSATAATTNNTRTSPSRSDSACPTPPSR